MYKKPGFAERLVTAIEKHDSPCVVGIDPDLRYLPREHDANLPEDLRRFCLEVLDAVAGVVPVVKFQSAYFERLGTAGIRVLSELIAAARSADLITILDAKRGDIGNTGIAYADAYLNPNSGSDLAVDALTISPYLGLDSIEPFVTTAEANGTGVFVCVRTSNPGSSDIQDQPVNGRPLYHVVADALRPSTTRNVGASGYGAVGVVVGGTFPKTARELRDKLASSYFLVPGIGAQGAQPRDLLPYFDQRGRGALVSASRSVIFPQHFGGASAWSKMAVTSAVRQMVEEVRQVLRTPEK